MAENLQINVTLPERMVQLVQRKVRSGQYATESDVIADSLSLLEEQENGLEPWLIEVVGPEYDAMHADPNRGIPLDQVQQAFAARRKTQSDSNS
jgi:antitoxin ParD1/3/4